MVKTRQQFKIAFRKRKSKLLKEKPLDGGVDDREEKSLVFYDKTQGEDGSDSPVPSSHSSPINKRSHNEMEDVSNDRLVQTCVFQTKNSNEIASKFRRFSNHNENEENEGSLPNFNTSISGRQSNKKRSFNPRRKLRSTLRHAITKVSPSDSPKLELAAHQQKNSDNRKMMLDSASTNILFMPNIKILRSAEKRLPSRFANSLAQRSRVKKLVSKLSRSSLEVDKKHKCISPKDTTSHRQSFRCSRPDAQAYKKAKQVFNSSIPSNLLCRETETRQIQTFIEEHTKLQKPGSLYISGPPGTGKTACLTHIIEDLQENGVKCDIQCINCMNLSRSHRIFSKIAQELTGWDKLTNAEAEKFLEKKFTTKGAPIVLILDEVDQLESKRQDVLYTMFEWPSLSSSRLILIGIANALDLTDRLLPRLHLRPECKPKLLHFPPYSKDQIVKILSARLSEVEGSQNVVDVSAVQFCARKIAAVSGDMRKALDICRRAVEIVEVEVRRQQILKPVDTSQSSTNEVKKVTIAHVSKVISAVYGSRLINTCGGEQPTIPLQQKILICTLLLLQKQSKLRELSVGQLHETYRSICKKRQVSQINQEDCLSLCSLLETRGIVSLKRAKEARSTKVSLKIDEREVEHALKDKILITSILQGGLAL